VHPQRPDVHGFTQSTIIVIVNIVTTRTAATRVGATGTAAAPSAATDGAAADSAATPRLRSDLDALPAYRPGQPAPPAGGPNHKLSSNENPFGPLPSVAASIAARIGSANFYPEAAGQEITARIAGRFAVPAGRIVLGSGSVEVISQLIRATAGPGDEVVFAWRSFEAYPLLTIAAGATPVRVPLGPGFRHDFAAMRAAVTARTRLIIVCSPNNPTGTSVHAGELAEFVAAVPVQIAVLIDEAYLQFNRDPASPAGIDLLRQHPNVVLAHTFSKAYGLAGLRIGYGIAPEPVATAMRKVAMPFAVTSLAQAAAVASLDAEDEMAERVGWLLAERARVGAALADMGWELPQSQANFFWFPLGEATDAAAATFAAHGISVRPFSGEGLRVSLGGVTANDALLAAAAAIAPPVREEAAARVR
jgi:histidinol-phosphate aminotransferase